jgi:hypothetical protein
MGWRGRRCLDRSRRGDARLLRQRCTWVDDADLSPAYREQRRDNPKQRWAWGIAAEELTLAALLRQNGY